jgi:hypothetical protein
MMAGAQIGGTLYMSAARLRNPEGSALDLRGAKANGLILPLSHPPEGTVDLTNAIVDQFEDGWRLVRAGVPARRYRVRLSGFTYRTLGRFSDDCAARLDCLGHAEDGYVPQAYDQLARVFTGAGREHDAHKVLIAKQRRRRHDLPGPAKAASYFLDITVGYGYRTWRAVYALLAVIAVGWAVFAWAFPKHFTATRPAGQLPPFHAWLYSIDAVLPVINLGQESAWVPTGAAQIWYAGSVLVGWLFGLGFIAYITARLFRE